MLNILCLHATSRWRIMRELIQQRLREIGIPGQTDIEPMKPGLGKTALWKVSGAGQNGDLVLRLFPAHDTVTADREALAMRTMREHGLPVPDVVATGMIAERPVMITTFAPGKTAGAEMKQAPERARYTGRQLGVLLGEMHAILAPPDLAPPDRWIVRGGARSGGASIACISPSSTPSCRPVYRARSGACFISAPAVLPGAKVVIITGRSAIMPVATTSGTGKPCSRIVRIASASRSAVTVSCAGNRRSTRSPFWPAPETFHNAVFPRPGFIGSISVCPGIPISRSRC